MCCSVVYEKSAQFVILLVSIVLTVGICDVAAVGEVGEADGSKATSYTGRTLPAWNQPRTACPRDFSQGAVFLDDGELIELFWFELEIVLIVTCLVLYSDAKC